MNFPFQILQRLALVTCSTLVICSGVVRGDEYEQTNLVSSVDHLAISTDPNLKNPWGVSFSPTSPFWISNQASGNSTLYTGTGSIVPLVVTIPAGATPPSGPTGQVFNGSAGFDLSNGNPAHFIFDTLNGTVVGWNGGTTGTVEATTPGAVYTGLAIGAAGGANYLYAADSSGGIRVFNSSWSDVTHTTFAGKFTDPNPIAGYSPFNIQLIGSDLYVTYARLTAMGTGLPGGYIDVFDTSGNFVKRFASGGNLYAPWGLTVAPSQFGEFSGDLLVGNFGNGEIQAYNATTGAYVGVLDGANGLPLVNDYLWALETRTGGSGVDTNAVYFTAGINNQQGGLFGEITVPEPSSVTLLMLGILATVVLAKVRGSSAT